MGGLVKKMLLVLYMLIIVVQWHLWSQLFIIFPRKVSFQEYYVFVLTQPPRHNFVVSAITFEGFKLRSSNLTCALLIQISQTSSIIDIVVPCKMAAGGHFDNKKKVAYPSVKNLKNYVPYGSEMARNAIESEFRTSKIADRSEMVRNAIQSDFRTSKMAAEKILYRSEMAISICCISI